MRTPTKRRVLVMATDTVVAEKLFTHLVPTCVPVPRWEPSCIGIIAWGAEFLSTLRVWTVPRLAIIPEPSAEAINTANALGVALVCVGPGWQQSVVDFASRLSADPIIDLEERVTPAAVRVLRLIVEGLDRTSIRDELQISESTLSKHLSQIYGQTHEISVAGVSAWIMRARQSQG
jgi:DNA-binding CsgD family transcriptional regulator